MWGLSSPTNLLENHYNSDVVNILLLYPSDPRSIIKTLAKAAINNDFGHRHAEREINFYLAEECYEVLARHFLLLHIFFDRSIPIRQSAALYLEVFGNILIQEKTSSHIQETGKSLVDLLLDEKQPLGMENVMDFSMLKQRDRDELADIFQSWNSSRECNIEELRDELLRKFYADRYDSREAVVDWDYQIKIRNFASIIHPVQYRGWRMRGQAFEFGDSSYVSPNKTMIGKNTRMDVTNGPFVSYGIACDQNEFADDLFDTVNKGTGTEQHRHSTVDVALYNITSYMWEFSTGKEYRMRVKGDVFSGLSSDEMPGAFHHAQSEESGEEQQPANVEHERSHDGVNLDGVKFSIVPVKDIGKLFRKKFRQFFDNVFISNGCSSIVEKSEFYQLLRDGAILEIENCAYDVTKNSSVKERSIENIRNIMSGFRVEEMQGTNDMDRDSLLRFKYMSENQNDGA